MRVVAAAVVLFLSSSLVSSFAQNAENAPAPTPQTTPVQPERTPQQSEQAREQDQRRGEDVRLGRDWRAQQRNDPTDRATGRGRYDRDDRTVGRNSRRERDDELDRGDDWDRRDHYLDRWRGFDDDRGRRRVKTCVEYENGDEYCRYR